MELEPDMVESEIDFMQPSSAEFHFNLMEYLFIQIFDWMKEEQCMAWPRMVYNREKFAKVRTVTTVFTEAFKKNVPISKL